MKDAKTTRNSPRRILEIVEAICENPESATASGLAQSLNIPIPTMYRWLDTLCEERFIAEYAGGFYVPGERLRNLVLNSLQYEPNITLRRTILRNLSLKLNETVSLSIPQGTKLIYFDRLESHWPFQVNLRIGDALPLLCCASGKAYLSTLELDQAIAVFDKLSRQTTARKTILDRDQFRVELETIKKQGYAFDNEEWFDDMVGVSVPIKNDDGTLIACLSTHALVTRKSIEILRTEVPLMVEAANELKPILISTT